MAKRVGIPHVAEIPNDLATTSLLTRCAGLTLTAPLTLVQLTALIQTTRIAILVRLPLPLPTIQIVPPRELRGKRAPLVRSRAGILTEVW